MTFTFSSESEVEEWFRENYETFGFTKIKPIPIPYKQPSYGDYIGQNGNKLDRIEMELHLANFFLHKPYVREKVGVIVCCKAYTPRDKKKREELQKKRIIEIPNCQITSFSTEILKRALQNY